MRISKALIALAAVTTLIAGCASQEEPATQAVTAAELSLAEVRVDAAKFAPTELSAAETKLAKIKGELAKEDYKDALVGSSELNKEIATLKEVVVSRQTQFAAATNEWESLSAEVPQIVQAIQSRVDTLAGSARLPKDVNKETFEAAKAALESMKAMWAEATAEFGAGHTMEAADKGRKVQAKGQEVLGQLGMMSPV